MDTHIQQARNELDNALGQGSDTAATRARKALGAAGLDVSVEMAAAKRRVRGIASEEKRELVGEVEPEPRRTPPRGRRTPTQQTTAERPDRAEESDRPAKRKPGERLDLG